MKLTIALLTCMTSFSALASSCAILVKEDYRLYAEFGTRATERPHYFEDLLNSKGHTLAKTVEEADLIVKTVDEVVKGRGVLGLPGKGEDACEKVILVNRAGKKVDEYVVLKNHDTRREIEQQWSWETQMSVNYPIKAKAKAVKKFIRNLDC